eukprot:TRINITY_DN5398_c2_g1_i2.p2 TRINITY_DN5398_c2_g1~~TRINITY_DN5398_c2_g1_i2.p2  ORF type:complete len:105 (+),score=5.77 TRINITY_DN5398_c2_g1_i2:27-317(+)
MCTRVQALPFMKIALLQDAAMSTDQWQRQLSIPALAVRKCGNPVLQCGVANAYMRVVLKECIVLGVTEATCRYVEPRLATTFESSLATWQRTQGIT